MDYYELSLAFEKILKVIKEKVKKGYYIKSSEYTDEILTYLKNIKDKGGDNEEYKKLCRDIHDNYIEIVNGLDNDGWFYKEIIEIINFLKKEFE